MDTTDSKRTSSFFSEEFIQMFEAYAKDRFTQERTKREYLYALSALCNHAETDFLDLKDDQVRAFFDKMQKEVSTSTIKYQLRIFLSVSRYLDENAKKFKIPPRFAAMFSFLKANDLDMQIAALPEYKNIDRVLTFAKEEENDALFLAIGLSLRCALTIHEIIALKQEMFFQDGNGNYGIRMRISPVNDRFIKIPEDLAEIIIRVVENRKTESEFLLLNKHNRPVSIRSLQSWLKEACTKCEVLPFTFNDLRNLSVAHMLKSGASADQVQTYIDVKGKYWFFRYDRAIEELNDAACDYTHIRIVW